MGKLVAVMVLGEITVHLPDVSGNYYTLCGMDGDDPDRAVDQMACDVPAGAKINCRTCRNIFGICAGFSSRDFEESGP